MWKRPFNNRQKKSPAPAAGLIRTIGRCVANRRGMSVIGVVVILLFIGAMATFLARIIQQRHHEGWTKASVLAAARANLRADAAIEVAKWEIRHDPVFAVNGNWCDTTSPNGAQRAPYTDWRNFKLDYADHEGYFRIQYPVWNWSYYCNANEQSVRALVNGRYCLDNGCVGEDLPGKKVSFGFKQALTGYHYADPDWEEYGRQRDTIDNYSSGGGNDNAGRALLYTTDTAAWYYDTGYCAAPPWKREHWTDNPYWHGAWGGDPMCNPNCDGSTKWGCGGFEDEFKQEYLSNGTTAGCYRAVRWSRLALNDSDPAHRESHTILSATPWTYGSYTRKDSGFTMHLWIKAGYGCASGSECSLVNKGSGTTDLSYGMFLDTANSQVKFKLNFTGVGLQTLSLPFNNTDGKWHFLVGTYDKDSGIMRFYERAKGGTLQSTSLNVGTQNLVANSSSIGIACDTNEGNKYNGYISEFRLANYAIDVKLDQNDKDQINYWYTHTLKQVLPEEEIADGCLGTMAISSEDGYFNHF